jgi:2-oxoglutarate/2-oxoacid ferredoxin oxidoreductase subunit alpha
MSRLTAAKVLDKIALEDFFAEKGEWYRYRDYDDDGVTYRTLPGTDHPRAAYFTRGTGHNDRAVYSERADDWVQNMERLRRKFETARELVPAPVIDFDPARRSALCTFGSNDPAIQEARDWLTADGIETNYLRIRALPLSYEMSAASSSTITSGVRGRKQLRRAALSAPMHGNAARTSRTCSKWRWAIACP